MGGTELGTKAILSTERTADMGDSIRISIEDLFDTSGTLPTHSGKLLIERAEAIVILDRSSGQQALSTAWRK